ncbi:hypothetical protein JGU66_01645 [Myxococcaceae bacterium JPH2]|nr:hypothetical protein [Myxococcaceae bacterium JPH2]
MKVIWRRMALLGLGAALGACATTPAPPVQRYSLGMARVDYRDYAAAKSNLCKAEPRWLSDELSAVNGMLARFLQETADATHPDAVEHPQHLALLQEAARTLPSVLTVHQRNLMKLQECRFRRAGAFPDIAQRGAALVKESQERLAQAPQAAAAAALSEARQKWRDESPDREATARRTWCSKKPQMGEPDLYFAHLAANERIEWLFCDGHRVEQGEDGALQLVSPDGLSRQERKRIQAQRYLEAARDYPSEEIDRPPRTVPAEAPKTEAPTPEAPAAQEPAPPFESP